MAVRAHALVNLMTCGDNDNTKLRARVYVHILGGDIGDLSGNGFDVWSGEYSPVLMTLNNGIAADVKAYLESHNVPFDALDTVMVR